jgi:hypothetical protein
MMMHKTIATCIAAATIALAAPAYADDSGQVSLADFGTTGTHYSDAAGKTVCADARDCSTQAPGMHGYPQASATYNGYAIPHGYLGKP